MPGAGLIPRGLPLTESMPFTGRDGGRWLAYVEGAPPEHPWGMWYRTVLPRRRLRFDSATESRISDTVPPGAPFLSEPRLQLLLESARPVPPPPPARRTRYRPWRRNLLVRWFSRAADVGDAMMAESAHHWRVGARRRAAIRSRMRRKLSAAAETVGSVVEGTVPRRTGAGS